MQSPVLPQGQQDADLDFSEFECAHLQNLTQSEDLSPLVSSIYGRRHKSHQPLWYDFQQCMVPGADNPDREVRVLSASAEGESAMTKPCACEKESGRKQNASGLWAVVLAASMLTSLSVAMYCWRLQGQLWAHENAMERVLETLSRRQESGLSSVPAEVSARGYVVGAEWGGGRGERVEATVLVKSSWPVFTRDLVSHMYVLVSNKRKKFI